MKLTEIYYDKKYQRKRDLGSNNKKTIISFEVFPPKKGEEQFDELLKELHILKKYSPSLVSLTYGAGGSNNNSLKLVELLNKDFNIMPHFTCVRNSRADVEKHINEIENLKIDNILALRGDIPQNDQEYITDFKYANELVEFIKQKTRLSIGVAGYPEGHIESESLEADIKNLKKKVKAGADVIFTQLFFETDCFFKYIDKLSDAQINLPVAAGIMPIISFKQIEKITSMARITIPQKLAEKIDKYKDSPDDMKKFGIEHASNQCLELIRHGVDGLHFYTLNKSYSTAKILENIL